MREFRGSLDAPAMNVLGDPAHCKDICLRFQEAGVDELILVMQCGTVPHDVVMESIKTFGIDPVHFGIIMILNLGIGLLTPPVGPTMVVGCAIGRVSMEAVSRSILIFYVPMLIVLALVTYVPALSLWLPNLLLK